MDKVLRYALKHGFTVEHSTGHVKMKLGKRIVSMSSSPSCPYAHEHALKDINRILKEENAI